MTSSSEPSLGARLATPAETPRAAYLFRNEEEKPPASAQFLVAVRPNPPERFAAAAAVWRVGEGTHFRLARQPGLSAAEAAEILLPALISSEPGELRYDLLLADADEWAADLDRHGFVRMDAERVFEIEFTTLWDRVDGMLRRNVRGFPASWRLVSITDCAPEAVWPLVAPYRLISFDDLRRRWQMPPPAGYARDWSVVLFDGEEVIGTLLVRRNGQRVAADIRAVKDIPTRQRALANLALFSFAYQHAHRGSAQSALFRASEAVHRETANLAWRLGGREVCRRHSFVRPMQASQGGS